MANNPDHYIAIEVERDISVAIEKVFAMASRVGMQKVNRTMLATSVSELATNIFRYGGHGYIELAIIDSEAQKGIRVIAKDYGPGITNIDQAMKDGFSTRLSMGVGLPGVKRMSDTFAIESTLGKGTTITVEKFV